MEVVNYLEKGNRLEKHGFGYIREIPGIRIHLLGVHYGHASAVRFHIGDGVQRGGLS